MTIPKGNPNETKEEKSRRIAEHAFQVRIAKVEQAMVDLKDVVEKLRKKQAGNPHNLEHASYASYVADLLADALLNLHHPDYEEKNGKAARIK